MDAGKHEAPSLAAAAREERSFCIGCPGGELAEQWANPWRITPHETGTSIADTDFNDGVFVSTWVNSVTQAVGFSFFKDAVYLSFLKL